MADRVRVLSIDGGGIRGIVPALVLAELERRTGEPTASLFDLIAGTSTGGILACALAKPDALSAERLVDLYEQEGPKIFSRTVWQRIHSVEGLADSKYDDDGLDEALTRYLGEARLRDTVTDVLIPAYDTERRRPEFFKSARAREEPDRDFALRDVARATAAAPTYFDPALLGDRPLIDGGVFAVNPGMCAVAEVTRYQPGAEIVLVSLGTGQLTRPFPYDEVKDWGLVEWARPLIDVVFDGASDVVDYQLTQLLGEQRFFRFQTELTNASDDLDDAGEANLRALRMTGERLISERQRDLNEAIAALTQAETRDL
ncbi:MAG: CBASS cGAMP-activated phospholipase [Solirubrobacterales bacterium]